MAFNPFGPYRARNPRPRGAFNPRAASGGHRPQGLMPTPFNPPMGAVLGQLIGGMGFNRGGPPQRGARPMMQSRPRANFHRPRGSFEPRSRGAAPARPRHSAPSSIANNKPYNKPPEKSDQTETVKVKDEKPDINDSKNDGTVKQEVVVKEELPKVEAVNIALDSYNSDLHCNISESGLTGSTMHKDGFEYLWGGMRASHGVKSGKVAFECSIDEALTVEVPPTERNPHVLRVGWSADCADLQLGEDKLSYGYGGTGKKSLDSKFLDYGRPFSVGDIVTCFLDLDSNPKTVSFMVNGQYHGVAYTIGQELGGQPLYPHITCKNMRFTLNFGGEKPKYPLRPGYDMLQNVPGILVNAPGGPPTRKDAEVIMMVGLPACGKTVWATKHCQDHPDKKYVTLGTNNIIEKMRISGLSRKGNYHGRWDALIKIATSCLNVWLKKAETRIGNYILDQTNVYFTARRRKMRNFSGYKRIACVIVNNDRVLSERTAKRENEEGKFVPIDAVMEMKSNFSVPEVGESFDEVRFIEEKPPMAIELVNKFKEEGIAFKSRGKRPAGREEHFNAKAPRTDFQSRNSGDRNDSFQQRPAPNEPFRGGGDRRRDGRDDREESRRMDTGRNFDNRAGNRPPHHDDRGNRDPTGDRQGYVDRGRPRPGYGERDDSRHRGPDNRDIKRQDYSDRNSPRQGSYPDRDASRPGFGNQDRSRQGQGDGRQGNYPERDTHRQGSYGDRDTRSQGADRGTRHEVYGGRDVSRPAGNGGRDVPRQGGFEGREPFRQGGYAERDAPRPEGTAERGPSRPGYGDRDSSWQGHRDAPRQGDYANRDPIRQEYGQMDAPRQDYRERDSTRYDNRDGRRPGYGEPEAYKEGYADGGAPSQSYDRDPSSQGHDRDNSRQNYADNNASYTNRDAARQPYTAGNGGHTDIDRSLDYRPVAPVKQEPNIDHTNTQYSSGYLQNNQADSGLAGYNSSPAAGTYQNSDVTNRYGATSQQASYSQRNGTTMRGSPTVRQDNQASSWNQPAAVSYGTQPAASNYGTQPAASNYGTQPAASNYGTQPAAASYGTQPAASNYRNQPAAASYGAAAPQTSQQYHQQTVIKQEPAYEARQPSSQNYNSYSQYQPNEQRYQYGNSNTQTTSSYGQPVSRSSFPTASSQSYSQQSYDQQLTHGQPNAPGSYTSQQPHYAGQGYGGYTSQQRR